MKKEIYFCDICNKELDDIKDDYTKQKYMIRKKAGQYGLIEPQLDLCSNCYERFIEFMGLKD